MMKHHLAFSLSALAAAMASTATPARAQTSAPQTEAEIDSEIRRLELRRHELRLEAARRAVLEAERALAQAQAGTPLVQTASIQPGAQPATTPANGQQGGQQAPAQQGVTPPATTSQGTATAGTTSGTTSGANQPGNPGGGQGGNNQKPNPNSQAGLAGASKDRHTFGGIDFGIGIAFSYDLGGERRVRQAELVNDLVRVTQADNARARMILESHYFFTPEGTAIFGRSNYCPDGRVRVPRERRIFARETDGSVAPPPEKVETVPNVPERRTYVSCTPQVNWGFGPFIALQPGSDAIIDAVGAGLMFGFRRVGSGNQSFNFGIGMLYDVDVRVLGPGIRADEALPVGETAIRYQQREQAALLVLSSFSF